MAKKTSSEFTFDVDNPLNRVRGESWKANAALRDYYHMGNARALRKLLESYCKTLPEEENQALNKDTTKKATLKNTDSVPTRSWNTLALWSHRYKWVERVNLQATHDAEYHHKIWLDRATVIREQDYKQGEDLRDLADKIMAESPNYLITKVKEDKTTKVTTITVALDGRLMIKAMETGSKLQRLAAEMENPDDIPEKNFIVFGDSLKNDLMDRIAKEVAKSGPGTKKADNQSDTE